LPGLKLYIEIWAGLVVATVLEVVTRSLPVAVSAIVFAIMVIAGIKAVTIAMYFQHLRYEGIKVAALPIAAVIGVILLAVSAIIVGMNIM